jgi:hypothetical protein
LSGLQLGPDKVFTFLLTYAVTNFAAISSGQFIGAVSPNLTVANALLGLVLSMLGIFSGFLITTHSIPDYWIWAHYVDFLRYSLEAAVANELSGLDLHCSSGEAYPIPIPIANGTAWAQKDFCLYTTGDAFLSAFDLSSGYIYPDIAILCGTLFFSYVTVIYHKFYYQILFFYIVYLFMFFLCTRF